MKIETITFEHTTVTGGVSETTRVTMPANHFQTFHVIKSFMLELGFIEERQVTHGNA